MFNQVFTCIVYVIPLTINFSTDSPQSENPL